VLTITFLAKRLEIFVCTMWMTFVLCLVKLKQVKQCEMSLRCLWRILVDIALAWLGVYLIYIAN